MNVSNIVKSVRTSLKKHSPEILTGIGIAGMIGTTVMAVKATPKALTLIAEEETRRGNEHKLTIIEVTKVAWKPYIPAAITGIASIACLIGANSTHLKRNAALATAYTLSETALREYKSKVVETIGEKKEQTIRDAIAKEKIEKNPVTKNEVLLTEKGTTLCYDAISGRYFKSSMEALRKAENEINSLLLRDQSISLNDFYYEIGLDDIKIGQRLGWNVDKGLVDLSFSTQLASDGTPCLVIDFAVAPSYDYY